MRSHIIESEAITYAAGRKALSLSGLLRRRTARQARAVVEVILVKCSLFITTAAGQTLDGRDASGFLKGFELWDAQGIRRKLTGPLAKAVAQMEYGEAAPDDPADLAASQTNTERVFWAVIPLSSPRAKRPADFAMPVDDILDGGGLAIEMPAASDILFGGSAGTIVSGTYTVYLVGRDEFDVEAHARDEWNWVDADSAANVKLQTNGALIRALAIHKDAAGGGTAVTTITDVTIPALGGGYSRLPRGLLKQLYLIDAYNGVKTADDLAYNDLIQWLLWPKPSCKLTDLPVVGTQLQASLTSTMAVGRILYQLVHPKAAVVIENTLAVNPTQENRPFEVKSEGKSRRSPDDWGVMAAFMPQAGKPPRAA